MSKKVLCQKTLSRCLSAMLLASVLLLSLCACSEENSSGKTDGTQEMQSVETGENLIIPISEITETAKYAPPSTPAGYVTTQDAGITSRRVKLLYARTVETASLPIRSAVKAVAAFRIRYQLRIKPLQTTAF